MNSSRKGAIAEHKATAWLLEQGWEVLANVASTGPADLVIWDGGRKCTPVDVKTFRKTTGRDAFQYLTDVQRDAGVMCLLVGPDFIEWADHSNARYYARAMKAVGANK